MNTFDFTLVVDRDPTVFADELFELGHGDLVPEGGPERNVVHAVMEAPSIGAAVVAAVQAVEQVGLFVEGLASDDLVSVKDIATRTGRTYESVRLLAAGKRGPGGFPLPMSTAQWALYSWAEVSVWFATHFGADLPAEHERQLAALDLIIRGRRYLVDKAERAEAARILAA